ncbi:fibronectin type III domain-containing protein [Spirochaeta isovalerica]|uniref:Fibronectin type III domain-containing protein n=1 Tax=Spirochaeta isovalerica TaxID=150 RepID=A0A841RES9_9SPIO|nr:fibronectin type III domain-containing protein [Spirochaeta isovalerica]MBB6481510.1 hypothetical protein [Spirochaeta isovalerica]
MKKLIYILVLFILLLVSCKNPVTGSGDFSKGDMTPFLERVELQNNVTVIDEISSEDFTITKDDDFLELTLINPNTQFSNIQVGNIVVMPPTTEYPEGFALDITEIENISSSSSARVSGSYIGKFKGFIVNELFSLFREFGGSFTIENQNIELNFLYLDGKCYDLNDSNSYNYEDIPTSVYEFIDGYFPSAGVDLLDLSVLEGILPNNDFKLSVGGKAAFLIKGFVSYNNLSLLLDISSNESRSRMQYRISGNEEFDLNIISSVDVSAAATLNLLPMYVPLDVVAGGVILKLVIMPQANLSGGLKLDATAEINQSAEILVGGTYTYNKESNVGNFEADSNSHFIATQNFDFTDTTFAVDGSIGIGAKIKLKALSATGPYISVIGGIGITYGDMYSAPYQDKRLDIDFSTDLTIGYEVEIANKSFFNLHYTWDDMIYYPIFPAPGGATNLTASYDNYSNFIQLNWDKNTHPFFPITKFFIQRKMNDSNYEDIGETDSDDLFFIDDDINQNEYYYYRVFAYAPRWRTWYSNQTEISTTSDNEYNMSLLPGTWYCSAIGDQPAIAMDINEIADGEFNTTSYSYTDSIYNEPDIKYWFSDNFFTTELILAERYSSDTFRGTISYDDDSTSLYPELVFTSDSSFQLTIYTDSSYSNVYINRLGIASNFYFSKSNTEIGVPVCFSGSIPGELSNLVIDNATQSSLEISWDSTTNATRYGIRRWNLSTGEYVVDIVENTSHVQDSNLDSNTYYQYEVRAGNSYGWGGWDFADGNTLSPPEIISTPFISLRPDELEVGETGTFIADKTISSNLGHSLEYRFNWGDGTYSEWSTSRYAYHSWSSKGTKNIKLLVRCALHTDIINESYEYEVPVYSTGTVTDYNNSGENDYPILDYTTMSSSIDMSNSFPSNSEVTNVTVYYEIRHTFPGDLDVWITAYYDNDWHDCMLFDVDDYLGGIDDIVGTTYNLHDWNGDSPNQVWYLSVRDRESGAEGYIDFFQIWIDYKSY